MSLEGADVYIDGIGAIFFNGQVLKVDLVTLYPDPKETNKMNPRLAGRLAMPINAAVQLRDGLNRLVADLQKAQEQNQKNNPAAAQVAASPEEADKKSKK
jgi:hypothetical protein